MKSLFKGHRRVQSESWSSGSTTRLGFEEQHSSLKRLNPISFLRRSSVNLDSDDFVTTTTTSVDAYKDAGIIVGTRTHDWSVNSNRGSVENGRVSAESDLPTMVEENEEVDDEDDKEDIIEHKLDIPKRRSSQDYNDTASTSDKENESVDVDIEQPVVGKVDTVDTLEGRGEVQLEGIEEVDEADETEEMGRHDGKNDTHSEEEEDKRSIFSFEDHDIGRNLSVNYHKPAVSSTSRRRSIVDMDYDGGDDFDYDEFDDDLNIDDDDDDYDLEDCSHLYPTNTNNDNDNYNDKYNMPVPPLHPPGLVKPLQIHRRPSLTVKIPDQISDDNDDDDFYDSLLDEVNAVPGDEDIDDNVSFRSLSTSSSNISRHNSASFKRSLSRRLSNVIRHSDNTITLFSQAPPESHYEIRDELSDLVPELPAPQHMRPILTPISERSDSDSSSPVCNRKSIEY